MESREAALPGILPRVLHYENIDILQHPSEENLPQPGLAGPRVPRPDAAVPASPAVKSAQSRRLRAKRGESQTVSKSLTAGWHRRVEAASLDSTAKLSPGACTRRIPDGSHPARPKQKQRAYIQSRPELLLAVMPHDRQSSFNEQLEIAN